MHYRRNADKTVRQLEREYNATGDISVLQQLNRARLRINQCPIRGDLDPSAFEAYIRPILNTRYLQFRIEKVHDAQFAVYAVTPITSFDQPDWDTYDDCVFQMRHIAQQTVCANFVGLIHLAPIFIGNNMCPGCGMRGTREVDVGTDQYGRKYRIRSCNHCLEDHREHWPAPQTYPVLYLVSKEVLRPSGDIPRRPRPGSTILADAWRVGEDPRALTSPQFRTGSYPTKIVLSSTTDEFPGGKTTFTYFNTDLCYISYDVSPDAPWYVSYRGDVSHMSTLRIGQTRYLARLLDITRYGMEQIEEFILVN
jgi:hypothetical protein